MLGEQVGFGSGSLLERSVTWATPFRTVAIATEGAERSFPSRSSPSVAGLCVSAVCSDGMLWIFVTCDQRYSRQWKTMEQSSHHSLQLKISPFLILRESEG